MRVAGIDYSTRHVDIVTINLDGAGQPEWTRVNLETGGFQPARRMRHSLGQKALLGGYWDNIAACYLEDPMSMSKGVAKALALVAGALMANIPERVVVERLAPAEWRQLVGLPGNATKEHVRMLAWARGGMPDGSFVEQHPDLWPQDACDAYCIALAGLEICTRGAAA